MTASGRCWLAACLISLVLLAACGPTSAEPQMLSSGSAPTRVVTPIPIAGGVLTPGNYRAVYRAPNAYEGEKVDLVGIVLNDVTLTRRGTFFQMLVYPEDSALKTGVFVRGRRLRGLMPGESVEVLGRITGGTTVRDRRGQVFHDVIVYARSARVVGPVPPGTPTP